MDERTTIPFGIRYGPQLLIFAIGYVVFSYAAVPGLVIERFDVGFTAVGLLMSAALSAFVLVQPIGGRFVDRRATLPILLALGTVQAVIAIAIDIPTQFWMVLALRALWGLVAGLAITAGATQIARTYTGTRATRNQGVYGGVLTGGGAVAFLLTPRIVEMTGWFGVHAVGGVLAVPALLTLWLGREHASDTAPRSTSDPKPGQDDPDRSNPLLNRVVVLAAGCYIAILGGYVTLSTFVTAYFDDLGVTGPLNAAALFAASLGRASGGFGVTHPAIDDGRLIAVTTAVGAAGLVAMAFGDGLALLVLPLVVLATVSLPFGAIFKTASSAVRRDGTALAIVVAAGNTGALVLPIVTGQLRDLTGNYDAAFLVLAALNAAAALAGIAIIRTKPGGDR